MQTPVPFTKDQRKVLFLSSLGGVLEFYDFIIYIFLAPIIESVFFANSTPYVATLKTLAIFSIGYLLRPIGGILFSHFGDRYGRKVVFLLTVIFMALPAFIIGILPTPAQIGVAAPILLLLCRIMQGLALGGEIPAAITFVAEHVPLNRRGIALSSLFFGINLGLLLGSLITTVISSYLSPTDIHDYGWRIPFLIGGVFGLIAIFLRRHLHETAAFTALREKDLQRIPFVTLMQHSYKNVLLGMAVVIIGSVSVFLYLYLPQYLHQQLHFNFSEVMRINTFATLLLNVSIIFGGLLIDKYSYRNVYLTVTAIIALVTFPLFYLFTLHSIPYVIFSYFVFSALFGLIPGSYSTMLSTLFPTSVRYSGIAMSYNLAYAIFGGLSPVICTIIINQFDSVLAPAFYVISIASISWLACYFMQRSKRDDNLLQEAQGVET